MLKVAGREERSYRVVMLIMVSQVTQCWKSCHSIEVVTSVIGGWSQTDVMGRVSIGLAPPGHGGRGPGSVRPPGVSTHEDLEDDRLLVDEDSILSHVVNNIMHRIVMDSC